MLHFFAKGGTLVVRRLRCLLVEVPQVSPPFLHKVGNFEMTKTAVVLVLVEVVRGLHGIFSEFFIRETRNVLQRGVPPLLVPYVRAGVFGVLDDEQQRLKVHVLGGKSPLIPSGRSISHAIAAPGLELPQRRYQSPVSEQRHTHRVRGGITDS